MSASAEMTQALPTLATVLGAESLARIDALEGDYGVSRSACATKLPGPSRAFWNTCLSWAFENDHAGIRASARFRLGVIEAGLAQAARSGKAGKFKDALTRDGSGFDQVLAELRLLGALGPLAAVVDVERPGRKEGCNYDLHLELPSGEELHLDSKWRTSSPLGELHAQCRLDIEGLLGRQFQAFAWASLQRNFYERATALKVATLVDEARRVAFEQPDDAEVVGPDGMPDWLSRSSVAGAALQAMFGGDEVRAVRLDGVPAAYLPVEQMFLVGDEHLREVRLLPADERGHCLIIPAAETQPSLTKEARSLWGVSDPDHSQRNPESLAIQGLVRKVVNQLPDSPYNLVAIGIETEFDFEDAELAINGEPVPDDTSGSRLAHGLVDDAAFESVSGFLVFTVTPPDGTTGEAIKQRAYYLPNPTCPAQLSPTTVDALVAALTA